MWRIVQRGFWSKYGSSVKSSTPIATTCEECRKKATDRRDLVHCAAGRRLNCGTDHKESQEEHGASGSGDGATGGPEHEWKEHVRYFQHDMWSSGHPFHYLEAIGWGTAVVMGVQMGTICHRNECRGFQQRGHWCGCHRPHDRFQFNKWFLSHVHYTAALVTRLLMPDAQRTVKRILPPSPVSSVVTSTSTSEPVNEEDTTIPVDSSSSSQQTTEQHDTELEEEFQNELRDFIKNLNVSSVSELPRTHATADAVSVEWNKLVESYIRGIHYNALALKHARKGDYCTAARIWLRASRGSFCDAKILFNLAICYQNGLGVAKDVAKAMDYYTKAAELNHARSAYNLAVLYLQSASRSTNEDRPEESVRLLEQAASLGLKEAQRELGVLLTEPDHRDMGRAVAMFEKASEQQDADAMYYLGICHERGLGTACNETRAAELYRSAASHGHASALYNLAVFFENGLGGIPQNETEAMSLYNDAAARGAVAAAERSEALRLKSTNKETSKFGSSGADSELQSADGADDSQPTLSRFYRSVSSSSSDAGSDPEAANQEFMANESDRSRSPVQQRLGMFFLDDSPSDNEASASETRIPVRHTDAIKPTPTVSAGHLLRMMFGSIGSSHVPQDQPAHHQSLGNFAVPKGSFGSDVLRHVSSVG